MKKLFLITTLLFSSVSYGQGCTSGDCSSGQGTYTFANGDKYVGSFKDGKITGQGTYTFSNGKYVGEFKDNQHKGQGTYTFNNGNKYVGEWKDSQQNGQGTFTWANGDKYVGEFIDNERNGQGTLTFANRIKTVVGVWENNTYFGTKSAWDEKEKERKAQAERERLAREAARKKSDKIYNACLLDKSAGIDMQASSLRRAVQETCESIAEDPSWLDNWKYN